MTRPSLHWSTILLACAVVILAVALYWSTRPAPADLRQIELHTTVRTDTPAPTGCRPVNERTWAGGITSC